MLKFSENLVWFFWESHENLVLKIVWQTLLGFFENFVHKPCRVLRILFIENLLNKVWKPWWVLLKICKNFEKLLGFLEKKIYEFSENLIGFFWEMFEDLVGFSSTFEKDAKTFYKSCLIFRESYENLVLKICWQTLLGFLKILFTNLVGFWEFY